MLTEEGLGSGECWEGWDTPIGGIIGGGGYGETCSPVLARLFLLLLGPSLMYSMYICMSCIACVCYILGGMGPDLLVFLTSGTRCNVRPEVFKCSFEKLHPCMYLHEVHPYVSFLLLHMMQQAESLMNQ